MGGNFACFDGCVYFVEPQICRFREEARQQKLEALEKMLEATENASEAAWKALVNEDRLLSR